MDISTSSHLQTIQTQTWIIRSTDPSEKFRRKKEREREREEKERKKERKKEKEWKKKRGRLEKSTK